VSSPPPARSRAARATLLGSGATVLISLAQAFVLIPLCLDRLSPRLFGAWLSATEMLIWLQLLDLGIPNALAQRVAAALGGDDREAAGEWAGACLGVLALLAPLLFGASVVTAFLLPSWIGVAGADARTLQACFVTGAAASVALLLCNGVVGLAWGLQRTALVSAALVIAAAAGVATSAALLFTGFGLWALALGLVVRAAIAVGACSVFVAGARRRGLPLHWQPRGYVLRELRTLLPATGGASVGSLLSKNTEIILVATFLGPLAATLYALTRKAADTLRVLLDTVGYAVYGGVASLVSSPGDRWRSRSVVKEILRTRFALACVAAACYVALNRGFVSLLFGGENYAGMSLTVAFALVLVVGGQGFLVNYLYRATGPVREGSQLLLVEAVIRALAMALGLRLFGLLGMPLASTAVAAVFLVVVRRRLLGALPAGGAATGSSRLLYGVGVGMLALGVTVAALRPPESWLPLLAVGAILGASGTAAMLASDAHLRRRLGAWAWPLRSSPR
jgi:O-antigen/teichoic acid export membrane protein